MNCEMECFLKKIKMNCEMECESVNYVHVL